MALSQQDSNPMGVDLTKADLSQFDGRLRDELERRKAAQLVSGAWDRLQHRYKLRPKRAEDLGILRYQEARVEVDLGQEPRPRCVELRVYSLLRPGVFQKTHISLDDNAHRIAAVSAGAMAEDLIEKYRDPFDPSEVARQAIDKLNECVADLLTK